jgi:hypothetical protein
MAERAERSLLERSRVLTTLQIVVDTIEDSARANLEDFDTCRYLLALFECGYIPGPNGQEGQLWAFYQLREPQRGPTYASRRKQIRSNQVELADTNNHRLLQSAIDKASNLLPPIPVTITFQQEPATRSTDPDDAP